MKDGLMLLNEDDCTYVLYNCIFLHKICINDEFNEICNVKNLVGHETEITVATVAAKKTKGRLTTFPP